MKAYKLRIQVTGEGEVVAEEKVREVKEAVEEKVGEVKVVVGRLPPELDLWVRTLRIREALDNVELAVEVLSRLLDEMAKAGLDMALAAGIKEKSGLVVLGVARWVQLLNGVKEFVERARELLESAEEPRP
jgi:predicted nucleic acid-binding protein